MTAKKKPPGGPAQKAGARFDGCLKNTLFAYICQPCTPNTWLIRSNFIKILVFQRYADFFLICLGVCEGMSHGGH
jgi:hypothetical protein